MFGETVGFAAQGAQLFHFRIHSLQGVNTLFMEHLPERNQHVRNRGGIVVVRDGTVLAELPLEIAGLMTDRPLPQVNEALENAKAAAHALGVGSGIDPFMTLSFMSLPVIPTLRLTTRGVIDVVTQQYV